MNPFTCLSFCSTTGRIIQVAANQLQARRFNLEFTDFTVHICHRCLRVFSPLYNRLPSITDVSRSVITKPNKAAPRPERVGATRCSRLCEMLPPYVPAASAVVGEPPEGLLFPAELSELTNWAGVTAEKQTRWLRMVGKPRKTEVARLK